VSHFVYYDWEMGSRGVKTTSLRLRVADHGRCKGLFTSGKTCLAANISPWDAFEFDSGGALEPSLAITCKLGIGVEASCSQRRLGAARLKQAKAKHQGLEPRKVREAMIQRGQSTSTPGSSCKALAPSSATQAAWWACPRRCLQRGGGQRSRGRGRGRGRAKAGKQGEAHGGAGTAEGA
jgi:hypothetical protein